MAIKPDETASPDPYAVANADLRSLVERARAMQDEIATILTDPEKQAVLNPSPEPDLSVAGRTHASMNLPELQTWMEGAGWITTPTDPGRRKFIYKAGDFTYVTLTVWGDADLPALLRQYDESVIAPGYGPQGLRRIDRPVTMTLWVTTALAYIASLRLDAIREHEAQTTE